MKIYGAWEGEARGEWGYKSNTMLCVPVATHVKIYFCVEMNKKIRNI